MLCAGLPTPHTADRRSPELAEDVIHTSGDLRSLPVRGQETRAQQRWVKLQKDNQRCNEPTTM